MSREHWFDRLNKLLTQDTPRRGVVGALTALALGHGLSADDAAGKNKGKGGKKGGKGGKGGKNGKGHGKGNEKKQGSGNRNNDRNGSGSGSNNGGGSDSGNGPDNELPAQCGVETCARELPEDQFAACVEKCGRCRIQEQFCVIDGDDEHPDAHATCCFEHQKCCQDSRACCDKTETCCGSGCCPENSFCCGGNSCAPLNDPDFKCCDGGVFNTRINPNNCGQCGTVCGAGEVCRNSQCVCDDPSSCGCLFHDQCPQGQLCRTQDHYLCDPTTDHNCHCSCGPNYNYCWNSATRQHVCFSGDCSLLA